MFYRTGRSLDLIGAVDLFYRIERCLDWIEVADLSFYRIERLPRPYVAVAGHIRRKLDGFERTSRRVRAGIPGREKAEEVALRQLLL